MKMKLLFNGEEKEVIASRKGGQFEISYDGIQRLVDLIHLDGNSFVLSYWDGGIRKQIRAAGLSRGEQRQVWVNGQTVHYKRVRKQKSGTKEIEGSLSATIPSVVSQVLVAVGDQVEAGDKLILLESMKMILPISAPKSGVVKEINCVAGDAVQPGIPLLIVE